MKKHGLDEKEMELVKLLMADCETTGDIQAKLKRLFAGTIEQMLEAEMDEHLGYEKNSVSGNNSGNSRNGYGKKTISSEYDSELKREIEEALLQNPKIIAISKFLITRNKNSVIVELEVNTNDTGGNTVTVTF